MLNHSCVRCHQHKIRCSGQIPCTNCTKKHLSDECRLITRKARPRKSSNGLYTNRPLSSSVSASPSSSYHTTASSSYDPPSNLSHHATLLSLAREAFGDYLVCEDLIQLVFYWKVQSLMHASIDLKKVLQDLGKIFDVRHSPFVEPDDVIVCMMTVALSLQYLPKKTPPEIMQRLLSMQGSLSPRLRQKLLFELSSNFVRHQMIQDQHSYAHIQTLTMLLVYDQSGDVLKDQIYDHAVRASQQLGLHCIESNDGTILNELKTRTWWFLVARNWFFSLSSSFYTIHPRHFTTRKPLENAHLDLPPKHHVEGNRSEANMLAMYCPSRFSFTLIKLADMIRNLVDLRLNGLPNFDQVVQENFEEFHEQLPQRYSLVVNDPPGRGDVDETDGTLPTQRSQVGGWVLHQLLFHAYLELHHFEAGKRIPQACISLAHHIIDIQGTPNKVCYVLDSLRVNVANVIKAASVLVVDLMQADNTSGIVRSLTLWKIRKALNDCEAFGLAKAGDFVQVKSMLELEDKLWRQGRPSTSTASSSLSTISMHSTSTSDTHKSEATTSLTELSPSVSLLKTPPQGPELDMLQFLPSDTALYPILQADSNNGEWARLYESFLDLSTIK